jgi:hypothetical protein
MFGKDDGMSKQELLAEIQKLPVEEQRQILEALAHDTSEGVGKAVGPVSEVEFERMLLARGIITDIPAGIDLEQEEDDFEPIAVKDKPVSETIIEERR